MADVRWKDKTLLAYAGMDTADTMPITDTSVDTDKYTTLAEVKKYALENKTIGGSAVGDVTTNNGTQTLTGKTLTSPKVNEAVAVTAKATEINKLTGCTATTAELNLTHTYAAKIPYLVNVTSDIQQQINGLSIGSEFLVHCYKLTFTASGTDKTITEAEILTQGGFSGYVVDHESIHGTVCSVSNGTYTVMDFIGGVATVTWTTAGSTLIHLSEIKIGGLTNGQEYNVAFSYKVISST